MITKLENKHLPFLSNQLWNIGTNEPPCALLSKNVDDNSLIQYGTIDRQILVGVQISQKRKTPLQLSTIK